MPPQGKEKLVLGSAGGNLPDAVTLDIDPLHKPDVVHDLMVAPYPFPDNTFKKIVAHHVLEHLDNIGIAMKELFRICCSDGEVYIEVPHHTSWCAKDPMHRAFYSYFSFDGYIDGNHTWVTGGKYRCIKKEITFHKAYRMFFLHKFFNANPQMYERFFCYMFPAEHFKIWLQPVK